MPASIQIRVVTEFRDLFVVNSLRKDVRLTVGYESGRVLVVSGRGLAICIVSAVEEALKPYQRPFALELSEHFGIFRLAPSGSLVPSVLMASLRPVNAAMSAVTRFRNQ